MRGRAAPPHPGIYRVPPPPPAFTAINWVTVSLPNLFLFSLLIIFLYVPALKHVFLKQTRIPSALWIINYFYSVSFLRLNAFNWDFVYFLEGCQKPITQFFFSFLFSVCAGLFQYPCLLIWKESSPK